MSGLYIPRCRSDAAKWSGVLPFSSDCSVRPSFQANNFLVITAYKPLIMGLIRYMLQVFRNFIPMSQQRRHLKLLVLDESWY
uniref:Uncharacterized protein n=1 Tax=Oryza glumipatula TaxID=40148 RepID=A0A0E0B266_9ORYZ